MNNISNVNVHLKTCSGNVNIVYLIGLFLWYWLPDECSVPLPCHVVGWSAVCVIVVFPACFAQTSSKALDRDFSISTTESDWAPVTKPNSCTKFGNKICLK